MFQVNYLGPFYLTELLLPALRTSAAVGGGRVINVASSASYMNCGEAKRKPDCLANELQWHSDATTAPVGSGTNYGITKFAQVAHMQELSQREAARGSAVTAYSLRPGLVSTDMTTGMTNHTAEAKMICSWMNLPYQPGVKCPLSAAQVLLLPPCLPPYLPARCPPATNEVIRTSPR